MSRLRRSKATWMSEKRKLRLPLKHFAATDGSELMEGVLAFLEGLDE